MPEAPLTPASDTPLFAALIAELGTDRTRARRRVGDLERLLADVEALHEPDDGDECPTCREPAPCVTRRLTDGRMSFDAACAAVRGHEPIVLDAPDAPPPTVPSLEQIAGSSTRGPDRFFDVLLGGTPSRH